MFEYHIYEADYWYQDEQSILNDLNNLGLAGWEAVNSNMVRAFHPSGRIQGEDTNIIVLFKRKKEL